MKNIFFAAVVCLAVFHIGEVIGWHLGYRDGHRDGYEGGYLTARALDKLNSMDRELKSLNR